MSEYRRQVIELFRKGKQAREIARELDRTVSAINSALNDARRYGELPRMDANEKMMRRNIGISKAFQKDTRGHSK